jgi:MFS family permease
MSGSMMQQAAILWHVSLLVPQDQRGLALGLVGLVRVGPVIGLSLFSGVAADAFDRRRLLLWTQAAATLFAGTLAAVTFWGLNSVWPVYVLAALGAAASAFDGPARQALIPALVPRHDLPGALSLNQIVFKASSVVGPALGGVLIAMAGVAWAYALNAVSFLFVVLALILMRDVAEVHVSDRGAVSVHAAREGLRFVFTSPVIRSTMLLDFFATFFASATALLPIVAQDILKIGPTGYGWLYVAPAIGSLLASAAMVRFINRIEKRGLVLLWSVAGFGVATVAFGLSESFALAFACLAVTGAADTVSAVLRSVVRQLATPDRLRGRMTSINMMSFMGGRQLGDVEAGLVAHWWGATASIITGGTAAVLTTALIAATTPALRRYRREPLPPTSAAATELIPTSS